MTRHVAAGWYADPLGRASYRFWDGSAWTAHLADTSQHTWTDEQFVVEERARVAAAVPSGSGERPAQVRPRVRADRPVRTPGPRLHTRIAGAWREARRRFVADLAVHWLAYLGVTLIFVGVFGFLAFTFDEVRAGWRPIAEVLIPAGLFAASWYLTSQRAPFAGRAVAALAAALVPIVAIASLNDGASIPPDLDGAIRAYVAGGACLAIAAAYAWWTTRHPDTPLRFLVGPAAWLGVAVALAATRAPMPTGPDVARADAWQAAGMAIAIAVSVALTRLRPAHPVADGVSRSALPMLAVTLAFSAANSLAGTHRPVPTVVALVAAIFTVDLLVHRVGATTAAVLEALLAAAAVVALAPDATLAWQGAVGAVGFTALCEWHARRRIAGSLLAVGMLAAGVGLAASVFGWWAMFAAWGALALWAHLRRLARPDWVRGEITLEFLASVLPVGFGIAAFGAMADGIATFVLAAVAFVAVIALRFGRPAEDAFARVWAASAIVTVESATLILAFGPVAPWGWLAGAAGLLTVALACLRAGRAIRWLLVASGALWTAWLTVQAFDVSGIGPGVRTAVLATLAVLLTYGATRRTNELRPVLLAAGTSAALASFWSLGDWMGWDARAWCVGIAALSGVAALAVLGLDRLTGIGPVWTWPWALTAAFGAATAGGLVVDAPSAVGRGAPGEVTAAALAAVALASLLLAGRWRQPWFGEVGSLAGFGAAASLATGLWLSPEMTLICAIGLGGTVTSAVVNLWRRSPRSPAVRAGVEASALLALASLSVAPFVGRPAMGLVFVFASISVQSFAYAFSWRMAGLSYLSSFSAALAVAWMSIEYGWSGAQRIETLALVGIGAVVLATALARWSGFDAAWLGPWLVPGLLSVAAAVAAVLLDVDAVGIGRTGYVTAGAALATAVTADLADSWDRPIWRWSVLPAVGGAVACWLTAADLGVVTTARASAGVAFVATLAVVAAWLTDRTRPFALPLAWLAVLAVGVGGIATTQAAIDAEAWHPVAALAALMLFVAGAESWTFGNFWHLRVIEELTPAWIAAAWCAFASAALGGNAQWYTVPIGGALLGVEEIERRERRVLGQPVSTRLGRAVEYLGMTLVVSAAFFQTFTRSASYAFIGVVLGIALTGWGALTRVRRRALFGGVATVLSLVLVIAVPLAGVLPGAPPAAIWLGLAGAGVLALVAAASVERGVRLVRRGVDRLDHSTEGWE